LRSDNNSATNLTPPQIEPQSSSFRPQDRITETPVSLYLTIYRCNQSSQCIDINWICDGDTDCIDGEDEINCKSENTQGIIYCCYCL